MARQLFIHLTLIALFAANFALAQPKAVQPAQGARPDLRPGDKLEVIDMGRIRDAEFVEFTPVGLIKVRFEDDSQLAFRPTHVRWAKGINPRDPKAASAAPKRPSSPTGPPANSDNPFEQNVSSLRKWSDSTGQFSVEAEFVGLADGKVSLKKADGKVIAIPLDKLAVADQAKAKSLAELAANPFGANVEDPTATNTTTVPEGSRVELATYRGTRWAPKLSPTTPWQGRPDPKPGNPPKLVEKSKFFPLPEGARRGLVAGLDDVNHHAWLPVGPGVGQGKNEDNKPVWFERIDLKTGDRLSTVPAERDYDRLSSVSPSGRLAAVVRPGENDIKIFDIAAAEPKQVRTIRPFHKQALMGVVNAIVNELMNDAIYDVREAFFLDEDQLLVQDDQGDFALLDLKTLNVKYRLAADGEAVLSPNRKYVAVGSFHGGGVSLVEALTGKDLGKLEGPPQRTYGKMAFHHDGTRLVGADRTRAAVWNLATGKLEASWDNVQLHKDLGRPVGFGRDHDHIVISGENVFNMKTGMIVDQVSTSNSHLFLSFTHLGRQWYSNFHEDDAQGNRVREVGMESLELPAK